MRRKKAITLNLPPGLTEAATAYAEATGRSFSSLLEDLVRAELAQHGALPKVTLAEIEARIEARLKERAKKRRAKKTTGRTIAL